MDDVVIDDSMESYLDRIRAKPADREPIRRCLSKFPSDIRSRGLFFEGVLGVVKTHRGDAVARGLLEVAGIDYRLSNFALHPHRDFYKVFYGASIALYPNLPLGRAMERIAEEFYPSMFAQSLAGKTISALLSSDPTNVLARMVDAYGIAVSGNEHAFERRADGAHRWRCRVEPSEHYPETFQGILRGMVSSTTGFEPIVRVVSFRPDRAHHVYDFEVRVAGRA